MKRVFSQCYAALQLGFMMLLEGCERWTSAAMNPRGAIVRAGFALGQFGEGGGGEGRNHPRRKAKESCYCVHVAGSRRRLGKASGVWEN